jgi:hypothetical protein
MSAAAVQVGGLGFIRVSAACHGQRNCCKKNGVYTFLARRDEISSFHHTHSHISEYHESGCQSHFQGCAAADNAENSAKIGTDSGVETTGRRSFF